MQKKKGATTTDDLIQKPPGNAGDTVDIGSRPATDDNIGTNAAVAATAAAGGIPASVVAAGVKRSTAK
ncbi:MAG: hypothetical protein ACXW5U_23450 [Thermoanaerobaculia bacterium]